MIGPTDRGSSRETTIPLSLSQREVWLDQCAWPDSAHLIIGGGGIMVGPIDVVCLQRALQCLTDTNEALRLTPMLDGSQRLLASFEPKLVIVELGPHEDLREAMRQWWCNSIDHPIPLDGRPPWRFTLLQSNDKLHGWLIQFHHLVMDGWGTSVIVRRWAEVYTALLAGNAPPPMDAPGYLEFIHESDAYQQSPAFLKDAEYWNGMIPECPPPLIERMGNLTASTGLPKANTTVQLIKRSDYANAELFAKEQGATSFNLFLAVLAIYFARTRARAEVVIGIPSLNRGGKRFRSTLGMFVGVFPVMVRIDPSATFVELLTAIAATLRGALRHARYPLSELSRTLGVGRHGQDAVFDILLSFERQDYDVTWGSTQNIDTRQLFPGIARYPLGVTVCDFQSDHDVELVLEASTACFNATDSQLLGQRLATLLPTLMAAPDVPIGQLPVLPAEERWALIDGLHQRATMHDKVYSFIAQFEHQAGLQPDAVALVWDGGHMSYAELDRRASRLAQHLRAVGAGRDRIVGMALERSQYMMIALLAIAKSGAAFLPIDPDAPVPRSGEILQESRALQLIVVASHLERYRELDIPLLAIDIERTDLAASAHQTPPALDDLAYVLFTSGSTGRPKGVMVEHDALARRLLSISDSFGITSKDRSGQGTQYTFDPSLIEILVPLIHGGSVALPPPGRQLPETLADFAIRHGVTYMAFVPTTLARFLDGMENKSGSRLRVACCGGEVLPPALSNRFLRQTGARLFNVYGPTETVIFSTAWPCEERPSGASLPVGQPTDESRIYVLGHDFQPQPFGVSGDIFIGGRAVARGYLNRPDLDAQAFFPDPFLAGGRIYRTGDRGYLDTDGNLYFIGRVDRQIKLRGYRIELGEIEARLMAIAGVLQAAVRFGHRDGRDVIDAWVGSANAQPDDLRRILRKRLPDYMMPATITVLPALPENSSGKIDLERLPPPPVLPVTPESGTLPPLSGLEEHIVAIWEAALNRRPIGVTDNFFDLGGDSLAAIDILASLEKLAGFKPSLFLLTENPTIAQLARAIGDRAESARALLHLGKPSQGVPLFVASSGQGDLIRLQNLAAQLDDVCDLYMLQAPNLGCARTLTELAELYVREIETHGVRGGYLAGFSVGGVTALETARLLQHRGIPVEGVILLDTVYPGNYFLLGRLVWSAVGWLARHARLQDLVINGRRLGALLGDPGLMVQVSALAHYRPQSFDGPVLLVKTSGFNFWQYLLFRPWRRLFRQSLEEIVVEGLHGSMFETRNIGQLGKRIAEYCGRARHGK